jgi:hypothetical protein
MVEKTEYGVGQKLFILPAEDSILMMHHVFHFMGA